MSNAELCEERKRLSGMIEMAMDAVAFSDTQLGKKISKRIESDLLAIRKKYSHISGSSSYDIAQSVARIQGREEQLGELYSVICDSRKTLDELNRKSELVNLSIKRISDNALRSGR